MKKNFLIAFFLTLINFPIPKLFATNYIELQTALDDETTRMGPGFQIQSLGMIIMRSMETLLLITGIWMFICIIWSGLEWQFARGNKSDLDKSKTRLTNCTLGLTIICLAYAVILIVQTFVGIDGVFINPNT